MTHHPLGTKIFHNDNGHAFGRGHAADVLAGIEVDNHGETVRDMVHVYIPLRQSPTTP